MIQPNEAAIWQVMTEDRYSIPVLHSWHMTKEEAERKMKEAQETWKGATFWLQQGTDEIRKKCRECDSVHASERFDHYGITTGYWCDDCYENHYPYRKDAYFDPSYAGERLKPEE